MPGASIPGSGGRSGEAPELVVGERFGCVAPVFSQGERFRLAVDFGHFGAGKHLDRELSAQGFRRLDGKLGAIPDLAADVVG